MNEHNKRNITRQNGTAHQRSYLENGCFRKSEERKAILASSIAIYSAVVLEIVSKRRQHSPSLWLWCIWRARSHAVCWWRMAVEMRSSQHMIMLKGVWWHLRPKSVTRYAWLSPHIQQSLKLFQNQLFSWLTKSDIMLKSMDSGIRPSISLVLWV